MYALMPDIRPLTKGKTLTAREEATLGRRARAGDKKATDALVMAHLKLVNTLARRYDQGLPPADLFQEGCIGLLNAVNHFDPDRGNRFSTYAAWWIRESINRAISNKSRVVRLPVHLNELMTKIRRVRSELTLRLGKQPNIQQIAAELGEKPERIRTAISHSKACLSLDQPASLTDDDKLTIGDTIVDEDAPETTQQLESNYLQGRVAQILDGLSEKERKVIQMRFGIGLDQERSLREISHELGMTRDQVGKISFLAMRKLKKTVSEDEFSVFLA